MLNKVYKLNMSRIFFYSFLSLLLCSLTNSFSAKANTTPYFSSYSIKDGLPQSTVKKAFQDPHGLVWLLTYDGTARFDGKTFTPFKSTASDGLSLAVDYAEEITSDEQDTVWVGGSEGLTRYSYQTNEFTHITSNNYQMHGLPSLFIGALMFDSHKRLLIGTRKGLLVASNEALDKLNFSPFGPPKIQNISAILEDQTGKVWVGTKKDGIFILNKKGELIQVITKKNSSLADHSIITIKELPDKKVGIGTYSGGLTILDAQTYKGKTFKYSKSSNLAITNARDRVWDMLYDSNGIFWIATWDGLMTFNQENEAFQLVPRNTGEFGLGDKNTVSLMEDASGILWIGTRSKGVFQYNTNTDWVSLLDLEPDNENSGISQIVEEILAEKNRIWVGTNNGLYVLQSQGETKHIIAGKNDDSLISGNRVAAIYRDKSSALWIGTTSGLNSTSDNGVSFEHYSADKVDKKHFSVSSITEDLLGNLWVGTNRSGIVILSKNRKNHSWLSADNEDGLLPSNKIETLVTDNDGNIWVGHSKGISVFNPFKEKVREFNTKNTLGALKNEYVWAITQSDNNSYWVATPVGLHRINSDNNSIKHFSQSIGSERREPVSILFDGNDDIWLTDIGMLFRINQSTNKITQFDFPPLIKSLDFSSAQSRYGDKLYFGARNGVVEIDLTKVNVSKTKPQNLTITGGNFDINKGTTDRLVMRHNETLSISFSLTDYANPAQTMYSYRLNDNKRWVDIGNQSTLVLSDLEPSNYKVQINAKNYLGTPSKNIIELDLTITPPWWRTLIAYFIYLAVLCMGIYALLKHNTSKAKLRRELLESEVAQKTKQLRNEKNLVEKQADEIRKINKEKTRLYETVSHELRTPITLILGPIQQLSKKIADESLIATTTLIERNATRLNRLVNQLLDLSRTETVVADISGQTNISALANSLEASFKPYASDASIKLSLNSCDNLFADISPDDAEKLLSNLLSNAIKYSKPNDSVILTINKDEQFVIISVKDTGIGIEPDQVSNIFTRFYRVDAEQTKTIEGSGIGLSIVKNIVDKVNGSITVNSKLGKGTTFTVRLPLCNEGHHTKQAVEQITPPEPKNTSLTLSSDMPQLLLIDDNEDILTYVSSVLADSYTITTASNGQEGIEAARAIIPDIVISDVMMPGIDGLELLETLKSDQLTNHIPIILLTAKGSNESKIEGLKLHADDYISKPFNEEELSLRLRNILDARDILKKKLSAEIMLEPKTSFAKEKPAFITKLDNIIENRYQDPLFSVAELAKEAAVGERQLLRKLKATADIGAKEYIRSYRLKKAAELLHQGNTATLVATEVGFSSAAYFSSCFKAFYGVTPSQYVNSTQ